jgi:hypothetical protein
MPAISQNSLFGRLQIITQTQPRVQLGKGTLAFLGFSPNGRSLKFKKIV